MPTVVKSDSKSLFSIATTTSIGEGTTPFYLDSYTNKQPAPYNAEYIYIYIYIYILRIYIYIYIYIYYNVFNGKCCCYPPLYFIFGVALNFIDLSLNRNPYMIIGRIKIWRIRQETILIDVVADSTGLSACISRHSVLLLDVGSSNNHHLNLGPHFFLQQPDVGYQVESEDRWETKWRHNGTIVSNHPKHHNVDWVFCFNSYEYVHL